MEDPILRIKTKLKQLKINDPAHQLFGAATHRYKLENPISEEEVQLFEKKYGIALPAGYREFLLQVGNGGAGPYYGLETLHDGLYQDLDSKKDNEFVDPSKEFPLTEAWNLDFQDQREEEYHRLRDEEYFDSQYYNGLLRLSNFGCGVSINLVVNGKEYGNIWVDDRCNDGGIYPDVSFSNGRRIDFLTWYETWLDRSLQEIAEKNPAPAPVAEAPKGDADAAIQELHAEAKRLLERSNTDETIVNILVKKGVAPHYAEMILENVKSDRSNKTAFYKLLLLGSFTLATGLIITFGSYARGSGSYIILGGIVVAGATMVARAFILYRK